jgi:uncharacterized protein (DUF1015 family)
MRSDKPSFYAYEMIYTIHGVRKRLPGFLCLVKLEELGKGSIRPHECTHSNPRQDRLNLLESCEANTSPIFSLYRSSGDVISGILSRKVLTKPHLEASDSSGNVHRLWPIDQAGEMESMGQELADKTIFIADGHHRYETSLEYRRQMLAKKTSASGERPYDYTLMFLADLKDEGITILPTHRLVKKVPKDILRIITRYFALETITSDFDIRKNLSGRKSAFGFFVRQEKVWHILTHRGRNLSACPPDLRETEVIILHELIFKKILPDVEIGYEMDIAKALDQVNRGEYAAVFFLNPTRVEDVEKAALSSMRMPPKSTYFYPKLLTGLVLNKWE